MEKNAEKLRRKLEQEQDVATRNTAFFTLAIALAALGSFMVEPVLENFFPPEKKSTRVVIHNSSTNNLATNGWHRIDHQRQ